jgi:hypothetical protein
MEIWDYGADEDAWVDPLFLNGAGYRTGGELAIENAAKSC